MGNYSEVVKHRAGLIHSEEDPVIKVSESSLQKDEDDVKALMNHIHSSMSNPFALDTDNEGVLINISTGRLTAVKNMLSNIVKKYMRDPVKTYFGR